MKILLPFTLLIAFVAAAPSIESSAPDVAKIQESLVKVSFLDDAGDTHFCTGFIIDIAGRVATAEHCISDHNLQVDGNDSYVIKKDGWIAIVANGPKERRPLQFAQKMPEPLEKVWSFGNAFDWGFIVLERVVAGYYDTEVGHKDLTVNAPLGPGMSGGPIVNAKGEVVAINQMSTNSTGIGCEAKAIKALLK